MKSTNEFVKRLQVTANKDDIIRAINLIRERDTGLNIETINIDYYSNNDIHHKRIDVLGKSFDSIVEELVKYNTLLGIFHIKVWYTDGETRFDIGKSNGEWFILNPDYDFFDFDQCKKLAKQYLTEGWVPDDFANDLQKFVDLNPTPEQKLMMSIFGVPLDKATWTNPYGENHEGLKKLSELYIRMID